MDDWLFSLIIIGSLLTYFIAIYVIALLFDKRKKKDTTGIPKKDTTGGLMLMTFPIACD